MAFLSQREDTESYLNMQCVYVLQPRCELGLGLLGVTILRIALPLQEGDKYSTAGYYFELSKQGRLTQKYQWLLKQCIK